MGRRPAGGASRRRATLGAAAAFALIAGSAALLWSTTEAPPGAEGAGTTDDDSGRERGRSGRPGSGGPATAEDPGAGGRASARADGSPRPRAAPLPVRSVPTVTSAPDPRESSTRGPGAASSSSADGPSDAARSGAAGPPRPASADPARRAAPRARGDARAVVEKVRIEVLAAEDGTPLDRAAVRVLCSDGAPEAAFTTSRDGRGEVEVVAGTVAEVRAKAPGRTLEVERVAVRSGRATDLRIRLARGVLVRGLVTGAGRAPLGGVEVRAFRSAPLLAAVPFGDEPLPVASAVTDRHGRYLLDCIPRSEECVVSWSAERLAVATREVDPQPDVEAEVRLDVEMRRGGSIAGQVTDEDGAPVEGAWVHALVAPREGRRSLVARDVRISLVDALELLVLDELREPTPDLLRTRTGEDGRFRLDGADLAHAWTVMALHPRLGRSAATEPAPPEGPPAALRLRGSTTVEVRVVDSRSVAVDGASLTAWLSWERWSARARGDGRYGPVSLDAGVFVVNVVSPREAPGTYVGAVEPDAQNVRVVKLRRGRTVRGVVRDDRGSPLAGATVECGIRTAVTDAAGAWSIDGAEDGDDVTASIAGHTPEAVAMEDASTIVLRRDTRFRVRLLLPDGKAPPAWLRVWTGRKGDAWEEGPDERWFERTSWDDGVVEILDRPSQHTLTVVVAPGYQPLQLLGAAAPGSEWDFGDRPLVPAERVTGHVEDPEGRPVAGAHVWAIFRTPPPWSWLLPLRGADTASDGTFSVALPAEVGECRIAAEFPGFGTHVGRGPPQVSDPLRIVLAHEQSYRGRIEPRPAASVRVTLLDAGQDPVAVLETDAAGEFHAWLSAAPSSVLIHEGRRVRDTVSVVAGTWTPAEIFVIQSGR